MKIMSVLQHIFKESQIFMLQIITDFMVHIGKCAIIKSIEI